MNSATFQILQHALDASNLRQQVVANNIANADTPGFKRSDVQFETLLSQALQNGPQPNLPNATTVQPRVVADTQTTMSSNGNNVNMDDEMVTLAENQLRYNALAEDVRMRLTRMQTAINGG